VGMNRIDLPGREPLWTVPHASGDEPAMMDLY